MKALSLTQPWASLVARGQKRIETRSWKPPAGAVGHLVAIHAAQGLAAPVHNDRGLQALCNAPGYVDALRAAGYGLDGGAVVSGALPRGVIVAVAILGRVAPTSRVLEAIADHPHEFGAHELQLGDFGPDRYGWRLDWVVPMPPTRAKGRQGLWPVPGEIDGYLEAYWRNAAYTSGTLDVDPVHWTDRRAPAFELEAA